MKSLLGKLGVILIGLAIFGCAEVGGWKFYGANKMYSGYYDTQGITRPSKNFVGVWTKSDYTEKGVLNCVEAIGEKCENLSHSKELMEMNCVEKTIRFLSITFYDNKGGVIRSISLPPNSPPEWHLIIPGSMTEKLYKEVCK